MSVVGFINMAALSVSSDRDAASLPFDVRRAGL
jgi:3-oxoacyl-(acyl-carrier-protein) synthase